MKKIISFIYDSIIFIIVAPFGYLSKLIYLLFGSSILFDFFAQFFSLMPGFIGSTIRACFYKQTLSKSYMNVFFGFGSFITKIETRIGSGVLINGHSTVGLADIGDGVVIANFVSILSGSQQHNFTNPDIGILDEEGVYIRIIIGNDVFIGDHSVVMANIGEKTIVGAGSIVAKEIESYVIAVGNPAKVVKKRN